MPVAFQQTDTVHICISNSPDGCKEEAGDPCNGWKMIVLEMEVATLLFTWAGVPELAGIFAALTMMNKIMAYVVAGCEEPDPVPLPMYQ